MSLIAIDFDGTIVDNSAHEPEERYPPLFDGVKQTIRAMRVNNKVMIFSCNRSKWIKECLDHYGIEVDYIWDQGKPVYDILIDDRAVEFNGNWKELEDQLA